MYYVDCFPKKLYLLTIPTLSFVIPLSIFIHSISSSAFSSLTTSGSFLKHFLYAINTPPPSLVLSTLFVVYPSISNRSSLFSLVSVIPIIVGSSSSMICSNDFFFDLIPRILLYKILHDFKAVRFALPRLVLRINRFFLP